MKKIFSMLAAVVIAGGIAMPALAQPLEGVPAEHNEALGGFGAFEDFLRQHPETKAELEANPNRVNNPEYLKSHPQLEGFLHEHPEARSEMQKNAPDFLRREQAEMGYQRGGRNFHDYLEKHPEVEDQLEKNPSLADDPKFMKEHPGLHEYIQSHPEVAFQMKHDPKSFFKREDKGLEENEGEHRGAATNPGMHEGTEHEGSNPGMHKGMHPHGHHGE